MRSKYKHWSNPGEHAGAVFLTTTCLDFVPCFESDEAKSLVAASLLDDCRHYGARLFGFAVMSNHVHLLLALPEGRSVPWLMARLKSNAARRVLPFLSESVVESLSVTRGLNGRSIWQVSYRGLSLERDTSFWQKLRYIHLNPVRAGLCRLPAEYRWSSARMWEEGMLDGDRALAISDSLVQGYADRTLLDLGTVRRREGPSL